MNRREYRDVVLARLRVAPFSSVDVVDSEMTGSYQDRPSRYIVLFTHQEPTVATRVSGLPVDHDMRFITRSVGRSMNEASFAADHVNARLLNWIPELSGRVAERVRWVSGDPIRRDPDVGNGLFFYEDEWSLVSQPA